MSLRRDRLADEVRDLIAGCFTSGQMEDPRLKNVTITAVKLSGDLQIASVYFRVMGEDVDSKRGKAGLESARPYFRKRLAAGLGVRRIPELRFFYDESVEYGTHIEKLLSKLD